MSKIKLDIYAGMLGAGKTTLIRQMLHSSYQNEKVVIIENEAGKLNLDASELSGASFSVQKLTSGCVCCTIKGSLTAALRDIAATQHPDRIILEPSGIADLAALEQACLECSDVQICRCIYIVRTASVLKLLKIVGDFFYDQIRWADQIYLNFSGKVTDVVFTDTCQKLYEIHPDVTLINVPLDQIDSSIFPEMTPEMCSASTIPVPKVSGLTVRSADQKLIFPSSQKTLLTWDYTFSHTFSQNDIFRLQTLLGNPELHCNFWRIKGFLTISDTEVMKLDQVFGEWHAEVCPKTTKNSLNTLIFIGPKINVSRLSDLLVCL